MLESCEDRTVPTVVTVASSGDAYEGGSSGGFVLTRDDTSGWLMVNYSLSGTATSGSDYVAPFGVALAPGTATATVTINAIDDSDSEPTETVIFTVNSGTGYTVGTPSSATMNIFDNDAQVVSVSKIDDTTEGGTAGKFRFTRIGDLSSSLTANFSVSGTATSGTDFTSLGSTVTFAANSATADKNVTALADNAVEDDETVVATVTSGTGYSVGSPSSATVTIADDPPVISVEASDTFEGAATGGFSFLRSGGDLSSTLTITYTVTGTATPTTDYEELSGTVTFDAGEDRVEVPVTAFGDNVNDDGETVIATIDDGDDDYTIDGDAGAATVTIADQPLTISVIALNDGAETPSGSATNATFRFLRSGDLSGTLTVTYTVSGTATSGSDYTALSGSVTFYSTDDHVDVPVYVQNDSTAEPTETVMVTLNASEDYSLGNDSDTVFITDIDTRRLTWTNGGSDNDFTNSNNWVITGTSTHVAPTQYDNLYFNGSVSSANCTNVGSGMSSTGLYGLHVINSYSGTLTLANSLSVSTFEQTSGTLNQPSARNLTITAAMLWSGGTLDTTDSGAEVNIDGAVARIDPPDTGSMATSSTFRLINSAIVTVLPGALHLAGGTGFYIDAKMKYRTDSNTDAYIDRDNGGDQLYDITNRGEFSVYAEKMNRPGKFTSLVPIQNAGSLFIAKDINFVVEGRLPANGPSIKQTGGIIDVMSGTKIDVHFGLVVTGGADMRISTEVKRGAVDILGDFTFDPGATGALSFIGTVATDGAFNVFGDATWNSGKYYPRLDASQVTNKPDFWFVKGLFTIGANAVLYPMIDPVDGWTTGIAADYLFGGKGVTAAPTLHADWTGNWKITSRTVAGQGWGAIERK